MLKGRLDTHVALASRFYLISLKHVPLQTRLNARSTPYSIVVTPISCKVKSRVSDCLIEGNRA